MLFLMSNHSVNQALKAVCMNLTTIAIFGLKKNVKSINMHTQP